MKKTSKTWVYFSLQIIFMLIIPCVFIWLQYGDLTTKYKISVTAIVLCVAVFWVFKKIILNKWIKSFDQKIVNIETNALSITDETVIKANKKTWRNLSLLQLFFNSVVPVLLFILAVVTIKTVEQGLIKLYGCLVFCLISVAIGICFRVAEIYSMRLYHEKGETK